MGELVGPLVHQFQKFLYYRVSVETVLWYLVTLECPVSILGFSILIFMSNLAIFGRRKLPCFQFQAKSISSVMTVLLGAVFLLLYPSGVRTSDLMGFEKHSSGILRILCSM